MAMPPPELTCLGVFKGMTKQYFPPHILVPAYVSFAQTLSLNSDLFVTSTLAKYPCSIYRTQIFSFNFSLHICMNDWCDEESNFWPTYINVSRAEEKWLQHKVVNKKIKRFTQTCLVPYYMASRMRKVELIHVIMTVFINLHCPMPNNAPTSVNKHILNLGMQNMLIERYTSLSQAQGHQMKKI